MRVAGLMSGTSIDAIDVALCEILPVAGTALSLQLIDYCEQPFPPGLRQRVFDVLAAEYASLSELTALNTALGRAFAGALLAALDRIGMASSDLDLVASHGQTLYHLTTGERGTWQMGEPAVIAAATGVSVVSDFRSADMARGGEGAPLVPYVDALLFAHPERTRALQNIGGIANVTILPAGGEPYAFDTGPGNVLIDHVARALLDRPYDPDGTTAAAGTIDRELLDAILAHPYFHRPPPKSTGREMFSAAFGNDFLARARDRGLSVPETLATATAITAESIARAYRAFGPERIDEVIVSGGGARNPALLRAIAALLPATRLRSLDDLGVPTAAKEALAFALLGYESIHGRTGTLPRCTGAAEPVIVGRITPGRNFRALMRQAMEEGCESIRSVRLVP